MSKKNIYLDNAAATPIDPWVIRAMDKAMKEFANPSSFNEVGRRARGTLETARAVIARFINARPDEIIFTSSGSEANNLAILGVLEDIKNPKVLTTPIEHPSVLESLKKTSAKVISLPVDEYGIVDLAKLKILVAGSALVSIMYANNEIGTIEPIQKVSKMVKELPADHRPFFHVDACQVIGSFLVDVQSLGVDLLTFNGSKIYGPRGIGVLYIRRGTRLHGQVLGGSQEHGLRAGTENLPAIVGLAQAISLINFNESKSITQVRDYAFSQIGKYVPEALISGPQGSDRLPNNIHIAIPGLSSENLLLELDRYGIWAGSGSACTSHSVEPSHVLKAIGLPATHIQGAIRFSLGRTTTKSEIDYVVKSLVKVIADLNKRYTIKK